MKTNKTNEAPVSQYGGNRRTPVNTAVCTAGNSTLRLDVNLRLEAPCTQRIREKVSPWSQLFRCAGFKGSSTISELVKTTWLSSFNRKKTFCHRLRSGDNHTRVLLHLGCHGNFDIYYMIIDDCEPYCSQDGGRKDLLTLLGELTVYSKLDRKRGST